MFLARLSLRRSFATLAMNSVASPASSVATATNAANASTVDASTSSSSSAASSTVDLVQWPYHALNAKHIAASDVHDALAAFAGASSSVRSLRILTRTLM
jgi:hypothetical protein